MKVSEMAEHRFEYDRISGQDLDDTIKELGQTRETFARLTGTPLKRVHQMAKQDSVPILLDLLTYIWKHNPGALRITRDWAADRISRDNWNPDLGDYPYLNGFDDEES